MKRAATQIGMIISVAFFACTGCDDKRQSTLPEWAEAFDASDHAFLSSWGPHQDDVWTVGGQLEQGIAWQRIDGEWRQATVPDGPLLNWVHGYGDTIWMVGNGGRILRKRGSGDFETLQSPTDEPLWGIWVGGPDKAWAVGGNPISSTEPNPVLLRWDGENWSSVELPPIDRTFRAFFKVWGTSADNVYAVGAKGVIVHFNGENWTQQLAGTARDFVSLWGTGPDNIVAVGGRSNGMYAHWNGSEWRSEVLPGEPGLNGVWVNPEGIAWLVGERGRILQLDTTLFEISREESDNRTLLHGVFGTPSGYRIAVGGTLGERPPWRGVVLETMR